MSFFAGLRSTIYLRLLLASLLFTFTVPALIVHFVPILSDDGITPIEAAEIAALVGVFSIIGRLSAGFLLDRFPAAWVGATAFLLPIFGCLALNAFPGNQPAACFAAILFGLTSGAEIDVVVYLTARHFGLRNYGALFGGMMIALAIGSAAGSLAAARVFDVAGSYAPFLWVTIGFMAASALALFTLPKPPAEDGQETTQADGLPAS
jgi:predicted MFS family arabinose efflux permease